MLPRPLFAIAVTVAAQVLPAQGPETLRALGAYHLTMPTVRKLIAAGRSYEEQPGADEVSDALEDPSRMSIDQFVAVIDRFPILQKAVSGSGMAPREFATASLAFHWAMRYLAEDEMRRMTSQKQAGPPAHVPAGNVELLRKNEEEIRKLSQRL